MRQPGNQMDQFDGTSAAVTAAGWHLTRAVRLAPGTEAVLTSGPTDGETAAGYPRGLLGAVAQTEEDAAEAAGTGNPALVAVHGLIDGLYNARPTLGRAL